MKPKSSFFRSTRGVLVFCAVIAAVAIFLHCDFWNWGVHQFYFGWIPREFLYRVILISVIFPLLNFLIIKFAWPLPGDRYEP